MRAVVQRVKSSKVSVDDKITGSIGRGLTVLIGVEDGDTQKDAEYIAKKVCALRVFDDDEGVMNLSVQDIDGEILAVSQFTLLGDVRKGNRPSYFQAAAPEEANSLYRCFSGGHACGDKQRRSCYHSSGEQEAVLEQTVISSS